MIGQPPPAFHLFHEPASQTSKRKSKEKMMTPTITMFEKCLCSDYTELHSLSSWLLPFAEVVEATSAIDGREGVGTGNQDPADITARDKAATFALVPEIRLLIVFNIVLMVNFLNE
jgi:hypothetical protein